MFDNLDFSKLKLPIEPQNLIYIYLAYKLINNLDKLDISRVSIIEVRGNPISFENSVKLLFIPK